MHDGSLLTISPLCCPCDASAANGQNTICHLSSECVAKLIRTSYYTHGRLGVANSHLTGWHVNAELSTISTTVTHGETCIQLHKPAANVSSVSRAALGTEAVQVFFFCVLRMPNTR